MGEAVGLSATQREARRGLIVVGFDSAWMDNDPRQGFIVTPMSEPTGARLERAARERQVPFVRRQASEG
ncbi:hypothetical protein C8J30_1016 [Rhodobacter viridis]|uniref:Uncharacterized protein n=1 Tax=Rhodobacter viridis TaxID=1054202 RepID=A0A318U4Y2_9RHOB|nr:hypothetical protein [Rhodobacter viridis]PYF12626.1 hypothetical protein C8J30_1016 [Rhodobacter viridis]